MGKSSINGSFSIAMLNNQRVIYLVEIIYHKNVNVTLLDLLGGSYMLGRGGGFAQTSFCLSGLGWGCNNVLFHLHTEMMLR